MGLYDVMTDISQHQILKTDTGDNRIFGVIVATVTDNYNQAYPGQVCIKIPVRDKMANELKWARLAFPAAGKGWGTYWLPEVGDEVLVVFEQGNIEKPYVIGCVPKANSKLLSKSPDKQNVNKDILFQNGSAIHFEDDIETGGDKDKLEVTINKGMLNFDMDGERRLIKLYDKNSANMISIKADEGSGKINVKAEKSLTIEVGTTVKIDINGETGYVGIKCNSLNLTTQNSTSLHSDGTFKIEGQGTVVDAGNSLRLSSSGPVSVQGATVKMG